MMQYLSRQGLFLSVLMFSVIFMGCSKPGMVKKDMDDLEVAEDIIDSEVAEDMIDSERTRYPW